MAVAAEAADGVDVDADDDWEGAVLLRWLALALAVAVIVLFRLLEFRAYGLLPCSGGVLNDNNDAAAAA